MSADNWTVCPRCLKLAEKELAVTEKDVTANYGKIPADQYLASLEIIKKMKHMLENPEQTLREDYDIGVNGQEFSVGYSARCATCGWNHTFKHEEKVTIK
jgi:hypothetical protein